MKSEDIGSYVFKVLVETDMKIKNGEDVAYPSTVDEISMLVGPVREDGGYLTENQVYNGLVWIRENSLALGWTVPNQPSGSGHRAYRVVPIDRSMGMSEADAAEVERGYYLRVQYASTTFRRGMEPLKLAANSTENKVRRMALLTTVGIGEALIKSLDAVLSGWE